MPLYLGKGLVSQKVNLIKGDSSASSGDEIKCLNETGKAVSEGDKVWINSASQVSDTENRIVYDDNIFYPIVSENGEYIYGAGSGIYKVLGTSIGQKLKSFSSYSGIYSVDTANIWRFLKNTILIPNDYSFLVRDDEILYSYLVRGWICGYWNSWNKIAI